MATRGRGRQAAGGGPGEDTRERIVDATIETLRVEGIVGSSARAIARTGNFNQALIYYHFGSIENVLVEAVAKMGRERKERYEQALADVTSLPQLAKIATDLHHEDTAAGNITVLTQILAGAAHDPELGPRIFEQFTPWTDMVGAAITKVVRGTPFDGVLPVQDLALSVSALFLGVELLTHLDPDPDREDQLFDAIKLIAVLIDAVLTSGAVDPAPGRRAEATTPPAEPGRTPTPKKAAVRKAAVKKAATKPAPAKRPGPKRTTT